MCATSTELAGSAGDLTPRTVFQEKSRWDLSFGGAAWATPARVRSLQLADVNGDRRADLCGLGAAGVVCALATSPRAFGGAHAWSAGNDGDARLLFGDIDGDGKADVCTRASTGVTCARSVGSAFGPARIWLAGMADTEGWSAPAYAASVTLADVDGDGKADVCGRAPAGIQCALSQRTSFGPAATWSSGGDFGDADAIPWAKSVAYGETLRFGDLNGDGRADVCGRGPDGIVCALSTGKGFARATRWLRDGMTDADGWVDAAARPPSALWLADVNGDGRSDLCADSAGGVACGLAP